MKKTIDIVSDAEVKRIHGAANCGPDISMRRVVDEGVLAYAFGFSAGHTTMLILREHGLLKKPRPGSRYQSLTRKGYRYLHAMKGLTPLDAIHAVMEGSAK